VTKNGENVNRISHMSVADIIVRNDEVVGSIPTSSTKFFDIPAAVSRLGLSV
jgi:hypothetical protein